MVQRVFGPIPLIVGVTGHRDLPGDVLPLEAAVRHVLSELKLRHASSRIVLLSSLAEGADRLVARIALELQISLVVPLPLEQPDYESDFATPESLAEFRSLLERADASFVVPPPLAKPSDRHDRGARSHAYANCGAYIVRKSVELIALWDGVSEPRRGTAEVVSFQLDGIPEPYADAHSQVDLSFSGPVRHVFTPRGADVSSASWETPRTVTIYPQAIAGKEAARAFSKATFDIDRFNADVAGGEGAAGVRDLAAAAANRYRARTARALGTIFVMVFLSVVGFNAYASVPSRPLWLLFAYLGCVAAAFATYYASLRGDWQNRYQDYRALAEVLRVSHYWRIAGIRDSAADRFVENHRADVDWLPFAIRSVTEPLDDRRAPAPDGGAGGLRHVYDDWLERQFRYFAEFAGRRDRYRSVLSTRIVTAALALSIVLTVAMRAFSAVQPAGDLDRVALLVATLLALVAALVSSYAEKRGWTEHVRRYELMATLFGRARDRVGALLDRAQSDPAAAERIRDTLRELGGEAIRESAAWLNLHRSRPINVPTA